MARTVQCVKLKREAPGLDEPPYPGDVGLRIYENISAEAWNAWLQQLTMIINENSLNTADPRSIEFIEQYMLGFLFDEGQYAGPKGFAPPKRKK